MCLRRGDTKKKRRCETFAEEFRLGLALILACWHQQDMRQHTLSSSFIIHAMNMRSLLGCLIVSNSNA